MLVIAGLDAAPPGFAVRIFGRAAILDAEKRGEPGHLPFLPGIGGGREKLGVIERTDGEVDAVAGRVVVKERRAALGAKATIHMLGTAEAGRCATRPGDGLTRGGNER